MCTKWIFASLIGVGVSLGAYARPADAKSLGAKKLSAPAKQVPLSHLKDIVFKNLGSPVWSEPRFRGFRGISMRNVKDVGAGRKLAELTLGKTDFFVAKKQLGGRPIYYLKTTFSHGKGIDEPGSYDRHGQFVVDQKGTLLYKNEKQVGTYRRLRLASGEQWEAPQHFEAWE